MKKAYIFTCLTFLSLISINAQVSETDISLTSSDLKLFINEFPALRTEFEELEINFNERESDFNIPEGMEAMEKVNSILKKHGYTDYNEFILKFTAIVSSYVSISTNAELKKAQPEIDKAIAEIENSDYPEEQKEQMKAAIMQTLQAVEGMSSMASQENIAVVKPFVDDIARILEND